MDLKCSASSEAQPIGPDRHRQHSSSLQVLFGRDRERRPAPPGQDGRHQTAGGQGCVPHVVQPSRLPRGAGHAPSGFGLGHVPGLAEDRPPQEAGQLAGQRRQQG